MQPLPRPSRRLDPEGFYLEYIPSLWAALVQRWSSILQYSADISVEIDRQPFRITVRDHALTVERGSSENPQLTFRADLASFKIAMFDLLPKALRYAENKLGTDALFDSPAEPHPHFDFATLREKPGCIEIIYTDDAGDIAQVKIDIGSGDGPAAQIYANDHDLWTILDNPNNWNQLLKTRIRINGDARYCLSLLELRH